MARRHRRACHRARGMGMRRLRVLSTRRRTLLPGHLAIQILRAMSAVTIVVVERDARRREFAGGLGADIVLDPADDAAARIKAMGLEGASLVLDLVGADDTLALAAASTARLGKIV